MARKSDTLRFTRVKLTNWRNFKEAEIELLDCAYLIGPNASGKSNFLDSLRFLRDLVKPIGGGLASAVASRGGLSKLRCLQARQNNTVEIYVAVGTDAEPNRWEYTLQFSGEKNKAPYVIRETVRAFGGLIVDDHNRGDRKDTSLVQTKIEQASQRRNMIDLVEFFASTRYLHVVPQIVRDPRRGILNEEDPFGGDLLFRMKAERAQTRTARMKRISQALAIAVPQFEELELKDDDQGQPHLYAKYKHWRANPSSQSEEVFSDGTLRLIGFLWSIMEKGGPLLLEEPELSLHDEVVKQLPGMIRRSQRGGGRQVLATTHSTAFLHSPDVLLSQTYRLVPTDDGTKIERGTDNETVVAQVEAGWSVADALVPLTAPKDLDQLSLFDA